MAPMTRNRAAEDGVPTPMMAEYYAQRAEAGLIITESTQVSPQGRGYPGSPGIYRSIHVDGWTSVVEAVHARGGLIFLQLWHAGRLSHPLVQEDGHLPVAPSAIAPEGLTVTRGGMKPFVTPRALSPSEIVKVVEEFREGAERARRAGFDGVEINAANGYLIDQFLRDGTNLRDDDYGGPIENRIRLLLEATRAIADMVGAERTAVRLSPSSETQGVHDSDPEPLFVAAAEGLAEIGIAFLELREPGPEGTFGKSNVPPISPAVRKVFPGPLILNSDFDLERAEAALAEERADAISFGRPFISNPDLPARLQSKAELAKDDMATWYSQGPEGYVDYPALEPAAA